MPLKADDLELVALIRRDIRNEQLPDPAFMAAAHRVTSSIPGIEVADHAHPAGIGCPDCEEKALNPSQIEKMRAELRIDGVARGIADPHEIVMGEKGAKAVGIVPDLSATLPLDPQPVIGPSGGTERGDEQTVWRHPLHRAENGLSITVQHRYSIGLRQDSTDLPQAGRNLVRAEGGEGIARIDDLGNRWRLGRARWRALRSTTVLIHSGIPVHMLSLRRRRSGMSRRPATILLEISLWSRSPLGPEAPGRMRNVPATLC